MRQFNTFWQHRGLIVADSSLSHRLYHMRSLAAGRTTLHELHPEGAIRNLQRDVIDAGVQLLLTNTADASRSKLGLLGLADRSDLINRSAARLTRAAAETAGVQLLVGGTIGAASAHVSPLNACDDYARQAQALAAGGVDLLWLEGFRDLPTLAVALTALEQATPALPIGATFTLPGQHGTAERIAVQMGLRAVLRHAQVVAVGLNADEPGNYLARVLRDLSARHSAAALAVSIRPESDVPLPFSAHAVRQSAAAAIRSGVRILLAGPDATPAFLRALVRATMPTMTPAFAPVGVSAPALPAVVV